MTAIPLDIKVLIEGCASGNREARTTFQQTYGSLIYSFPVRVFHLSADQAGDFYLYVFDKGRVFSRIRSFQGRNAIQFGTFLSYFVLKDLCLEWLRTREPVETVSMDTSIMDSESERARTNTMQDVLPAKTPTPEAALVKADDVRDVESILQQLDEEKRLILKLLALDTVELGPEDIRGIAHIASRSIRETLDRIEEARKAMAAKSMKAQKKREQLYSVAYWIHVYRRRIATLAERLRHRCASETTQGLAQERVELERKLDWRYNQHRRLREELRRFDVRPSYKDMASILNVPVGTISSRIARARKEFGQKLSAAR